MEYTTKYNFNNFFEKKIVKIIIERWFKEENVIILRKENWLIPFIEQIIILKTDKKIINLFIFNVKINRRGIIFWTVLNKKQFIHLKPSITFGTQK
jgi:hypothetical protein